MALYLRVERRGPPLPEGPVLVVANHLNALVDPLVLFRTAGRPTRPLAKAPLFRHPLVGPVLKGLGGLPVFRPGDDPDQVHRNEETFGAAVDALHRGQAVQIYPEGQSHSEPSLTRIRTGAARIAFAAEAASGWTLGLRIVPVGLVYRRKNLFRGAAVATYGEPLELARWRTAWDRDEREAVRELTDAVGARLAEVTLNLPSELDRVLVEVAEALHARGTGQVAPRERVALGSRVPRLQAFADGLKDLRRSSPDTYLRLRDRVLRYRHLQKLLGSTDETAVPDRYAAGAVVRYIVRRGAVLALLTPVAAMAVVAWWLPYQVPRLVVRILRPPLDAVSTWKLGTALLAFPVVLAGWVAAATILRGPLVGSAVGMAAVLAGLGWIAWSDHWRRASEDVRVFVRAGPRRRSRERLAALRQELVEMFETLARPGEGPMASALSPSAPPEAPPEASKLAGPEIHSASPESGPDDPGTSSSAGTGVPSTR